MREVAIIGIGCVPARGLSPDVSYREITYEAAVKAYHDAGVGPRDVDTFMTASEDFHEGVSIYDEYTPDQLGAVLKPVHTISGDGLMAIAAAYLQIATGGFRIAVVEAHSKASNILTPKHVAELALDPIYCRHLGLPVEFIAGLDMRKFMHEEKVSLETLAKVVALHRENALYNELACYGAALTPEDVLATEEIASPLRKGMVAAHADGACVVVLACRDVALATRKPIWVDGLAFFTAENMPDTWAWGKATYAELCAKKAFAMAGIAAPSREVDFAEVDDRFAHKALVHLQALGLLEPGKGDWAYKTGKFSVRGEIPVNVSGGHLGIGSMHETTCLYQLYEAVKQLRGEAGERQLCRARCGIVQSWRGLPTQTGALLVLRN